MYCQIHGSNVYAQSGTGWQRKDAREIMFGPHQMHNLHCYRRIRVYKDAPLARWIDIFHNPTGQDVTVPLRYYSQFQYGIGQVTTNSGKGNFTDDDWAFVTSSRHMRNNPSVMHVVCGPRSKVRPKVNWNSNSLYYNYRVTVPAGQTVAMLHFESQHNDVGKLRKMMKEFEPRRYVRDLSGAARSMILNFNLSSGFGGVSLDRLDAADQATFYNGDIVRGEITNESFTIKTFFGEVSLPADRVVGMASVGPEEPYVLLVLTDGQVLYGTLDDQQLRITISGGGRLSVPFDRMSQWSYRISRARPEEKTFRGPYLDLRTGDRLAFDPETVEFRVQSRYGPLTLDHKSLMHIQLDNEKNTIHRIRFLNGSVIGGFLQPATVGCRLRLGQQIEIPRDEVSAVEFAPEEKRDLGQSRASLTNGDVVFGAMDEENISLRTAYGEVTVQPQSVKMLSFSNRRLGRCALLMWDGTVLRGQLQSESLRFRVSDGPTIRLFPNQCALIVRSHAIPHAKILKRVEELVALLGAESFADRQRASQELIGLGAAVRPLLEQAHKRSRDPEVRQRLEDVLGKIGAGDSTSSAPELDRRMELMLKIRAANRVVLQVER
jgi:hypothetical protein